MTQVSHSLTHYDIYESVSDSSESITDTLGDVWICELLKISEMRYLLIKVH